MNTSRLKEHLPDSLRPLAAALYHIPARLARSSNRPLKLMSKLVDRFKSRNSLIPPESVVFVGPGDFVATGNEFKGYFVELAGLQRDERVLDVGCGIGRMAVPLTHYLSSEGEYHGFDIVRYGIKWCRRHISSRFPNFHFDHVDVHNKRYNKRGRLRASEVVFPFAEEYFDFVFLTSVFTHMLPSGVERYLSEIERVLRRGGRCLITFFLLNEESRKFISMGRSSQAFQYELDGCMTVDKGNPEAVIAYDEGRIRGMLAERKLDIVDPIRYGEWCGRETALSYQDILVAVKGRSD